MSDTVLVTGHLGFVGRHLVDALTDSVVYGTEDLRLTLPTMRNPVDVVVHLAANIVNVDTRQKMGISAYDDILLDHYVCRWVEKNPPKKVFVVMSSCAVDFPDDPYCIVKRTLEAFAMTLHKQGIPVMILRPFSGYGADQSEEYPFRAILERARRRENPLTVWGGTQVRDWLYIDDLVDAIIHGIDHFPGGVPIEIGTGVGTDVATLAGLLAKTVGYEPEIVGDRTKAVSSTRRVANPEQAAGYGWSAKTPLMDGIRSVLTQLVENT